MREIKFRVWDADNNEMLGPFDLTQNPIYWANKMRDGVLMRYTGLKDKDGREIYEYDIVRGEVTDSDGTEKYMGVVMYFAPSFEIIGIKQHDGLSRVLERQCEVIGNIYENKNLLEEK